MGFISVRVKFSQRMQYCEIRENYPHKKISMFTVTVVNVTEKYWEMCSYSESTALKLAMGCPEEFVNHNKRFLSRIYPNGMRVDSSNYNPQDFWNCGCQMGRC